MKLHILLNAPLLVLSFLCHLLHSDRFPCKDFPQENGRSRLIGTGRPGCLFLPLLSLLVLCDLSDQSFLPPESKFDQRFTCEAFLVGSLSGMEGFFFLLCVISWWSHVVLFAWSVSVEFRTRSPSASFSSFSLHGVSIFFDIIIQQAQNERANG